MQPLLIDLAQRKTRPRKWSPRFNIGICTIEVGLKTLVTNPLLCPMFEETAPARFPMNIGPPEPLIDPPWLLTMLFIIVPLPI